jgi:hypothetical protein
MNEIEKGKMILPSLEIIKASMEPCDCKCSGSKIRMRILRHGISAKTSKTVQDLVTDSYKQMLKDLEEITIKPDVDLFKVEIAPSECGNVEVKIAIYNKDISIKTLEIVENKLTEASDLIIKDIDNYVAIIKGIGENG